MLCWRMHACKRLDRPTRCAGLQLVEALTQALPLDIESSHRIISVHERQQLWCVRPEGWSGAAGRSDRGGRRRARGETWQPQGRQTVNAEA